MYIQQNLLIKFVLSYRLGEGSVGSVGIRNVGIRRRLLQVVNSSRVWPKVCPQLKCEEETKRDGWGRAWVCGCLLVFTRGFFELCFALVVLRVLCSAHCHDERPVTTSIQQRNTYTFTFALAQRLCITESFPVSICAPWALGTEKCCHSSCIGSYSHCASLCIPTPPSFSIEIELTIESKPNMLRF